MANLKNVIYLSNEDYYTLASTGTVTIGGTTLTYDENNVYITPDSVYYLQSNNATSADAIQYISAISNTSASGSGTTKYLHKGTTSVVTGITAGSVTATPKYMHYSPNTPTGVSTDTLTFSGGSAASRNSTTVGSGSIQTAGSVTLGSSNENASGRVQYVSGISNGDLAVSYTAPVLGTKTISEVKTTGSVSTLKNGSNAVTSFKSVNTVTAGSASSLTYNDTASGGQAFITGVSINSQGTVSLIGTRTEIGSGTKARRCLVITGSHSGTSLSAPTKYMHFSANTPTAVSTDTLTFTVGTAMTKQDATVGSGSFTSSGSASLSGNVGHTDAYVYATYTDPVLATKSIYEITGVGSVATLKKNTTDVTTFKAVNTVTAGTASSMVYNTTADSGEAYVPSVSYTSASASGTANAVTSITANTTATDAIATYLQDYTVTGGTTTGTIKYLTLEEEGEE